MSRLQPSARRQKVQQQPASSPGRVRAGRHRRSDERPDPALIQPWGGRRSPAISDSSFLQAADPAAPTLIAAKLADQSPRSGICSPAAPDTPARPSKRQPRRRDRFRREAAVSAAGSSRADAAAAERFRQSGRSWGPAVATLLLPFRSGSGLDRAGHCRISAEQHSCLVLLLVAQCSSGMIAPRECSSSSNGAVSASDERALAHSALRKSGRLGRCQDRPDVRAYPADADLGGLARDTSTTAPFVPMSRVNWGESGSRPLPVSWRCTIPPIVWRDQLPVLIFADGAVARGGTSSSTRQTPRCPLRTTAPVRGFDPLAQPGRATAEEAFEASTGLGPHAVDPAG
jgi:hypothetical protein